MELNEAPIPFITNNILTNLKPNQKSQNLKKEKKIKLKDKDEQEYTIYLKLFEKSIVIEASISNDIVQIKYSNNLSIEDFAQFNSFLAQYTKIEKLFELLEDMKSDEFKICKINPEFIEFYLLIEVRKKLIEIPIKLLMKKNDVNIILKNIYEIVQNIKDKEIEDLKKRNENLENQILKINEKLEMFQKFEKIINDDKKRIDDLQKEKREDKKMIDDLQKKIKENEKEINDLKEKIEKINDIKIVNSSKEIINYKKEDNNKLEKLTNDIEINKIIITKIPELKKDEFYDSMQYIINNSISINSVIIKNDHELAQINNGIKRQKNKNIKKFNLLFKCTKDGDSWKDYHSKCDGHKNLLTLVETSEGRKFGGFSSLLLKSSGGGQKDETAFIFSLDKKQNYYIKKGKNAVYFEERGPIFGQTYGSYSEFTLNCGQQPCLTGENSYDDTGSRCCYDYGEGKKYVLAGKFEFRVLEYEVFELEFTE